MSDPSTWERLSHPARDALWKAAQLANAPLPAAVLCGGEEGVVPVFGPLSRMELVTLRLHPVWGHSVELGPRVRSSIRAGAWALGGHQLDALQELVASVSAYYFSHQLLEPEDMRDSAALLEPHLDLLAELARRLELWAELAHVLHRRALYVSWEGRELERALKYAQEAVALLRKGERPHPGTLALFETEVAYLLTRLGRSERAKQVLLEAEQLLLQQLGSDGKEPYLLYCQLAQVAKAAGDAQHLARARQEAEALASELATDASHRQRLLAHVGDPQPWSRWEFQRYAGL